MYSFYSHKTVTVFCCCCCFQIKVFLSVGSKTYVSFYQLGFLATVSCVGQSKGIMSDRIVSVSWL